MLECNRTDVSGGIDVNKTNLSKECDIFQYWHFKDIGFKYEKYLCNVCHDLMQKAMSFILSVLKEVLTEFFFGIWAKMMQLMNGSHLVDKRGVL